MDQEIAQADAKMQAAVVDTIGRQAPDAQIDPTSAQVIQASLRKAVGAITNGEVNLPIAEQPGTGPLNPQAYTALSSFEALIDKLVKSGIEEARPYKIDAKLAASDPNRLIQAAGIISKAGKDTALQTAVRKAGASSSKEPSKTPEKPVASASQPPSKEPSIGAKMAAMQMGRE